MKNARLHRIWSILFPASTLIFINVMITPTSAADNKEFNRLEQKEFGQMPDGRKVSQFTLRNRNGMVVKVIPFGATITDIQAPDRNGKLAHVLLGSDNFEAYLKGHPAAASVIGRFANRIAKARFSIDGTEYQVAANNGRNHIHGGRVNFARVLWESKTLPPETNQAGVQFTYLSKDGEEGFPGNLTVSVTYTLTDANELKLAYEARTDKPTIVNLTNHAYFNLAGSGDVLGQELWIDAEQYTPSDAELIPTGEIALVKGTPLDFTSPTPIGARINQLKPNPNGYDHNYVLKTDGKSAKLFARVMDPKGGRVMEVSTTEPGVQLYTANHVRNFTGVDGAVFGAHPAFCLETQHYPDSINKLQFPSPILRPGSPFKSTTIFKFSAR